MIRKINKILVVDLEATCWEGDKPPEDQISDIIEIGYCLFDLVNDVVVSNESIYVIPKRSKITEFCTNLTGITDKIIKDEGIPFDGACNKIKKVGKKYSWCSYGTYDLKMMRRQCLEYNVEYPLNETHLDIKMLYGLFNLDKPILDLSQTLLELGSTFEGILHCGKDDARNAAKIVSLLLKKI